jgi:hypothetical protein
VIARAEIDRQLAGRRATGADIAASRAEHARAIAAELRERERVLGSSGDGRPEDARARRVAP